MWRRSQKLDPDYCFICKSYYFSNVKLQVFQILRNWKQLIVHHKDRVDTCLYYIIIKLYKDSTGLLLPFLLNGSSAPKDGNVLAPVTLTLSRLACYLYVAIKFTFKTLLCSQLEILPLSIREEVFNQLFFGGKIMVKWIESNNQQSNKVPFIFLIDYSNIKSQIIIYSIMFYFKMKLFLNENLK